MDASKIIDLVKGLGRTYGELVRDGLIQDGALAPLFKEGENEDLIHKPAPGISLWFWAETSKLERIAITLIPRDEDIPVYTGQLPSPFTHKMTQASVHAALGVPDRTKGPVKLPLPAGMTGGWDAYRLDRSLHTNAEVALQFTSEKTVCGLAFRLIDKGHD